MARHQRQEIEFELEDDTDECENEVELAIPQEQRALITESKDLSIRELHFQVMENELKLNPSFQRQYVFDDIKASRLIESLLMDVPLPTIYLSQEVDETNEVIDGQQRLTSFIRFIKNEFSLKRLTVFKELNGKWFKDLPKDITGKILKSTLRCIIVKSDSNPEIKFDIFERLNSGSIHLTKQELRNCIFRGSYSNLLRELVTEPDWLRLIGAKEPHKRMLDCEMILRFFAFYHGSNTYSAPMSKFLNNEANIYQNASLETIKNLRQVFTKSVKMSLTVFGDQAFKRLEAGNQKDPNARFDRKLNMSLFDVVMVGFTQYEPRDIVPKSDAIRSKLDELMTTNEEFKDTILLSTSSRNKVQKRFLIWFNALSKIIKTPEKDLRCFSDAFRRQLYDADSTCSICKQQIMSLEDSVVDHHIPYSLGGPTEPGNGYLQRIAGR